MNNAQLLNAIRKSLNTEYQTVVPEADSRTGYEIYEILEQFPTAKNMFIDTLVNKVVLTKMYGQGWQNPLKAFHKGKLPFGQSIEQIFVEDAKRKAFTEHFEGSTSEEGDVLGKKLSKVHVNYISVNFMNKYAVSISREQLQTAFSSDLGLSLLVNALIQSIYEQAEVDEFEYTKHCLYNLIGDSATSVDQSKTNMFINLNAKEITHANATSFLTTLKGTSGRLGFKSDKYNFSGVNTFTKKDKMVLLATPETIANLDVNALATLFQIEKGELKYRVVEVDELPFLGETYVAPKANALTDSSGKYQNVKEYTIAPHLQNTQIEAILVDEDTIQFYDSLITTRQMENPNSLIINIFLHKHGVAGSNPFTNFVCFYTNQNEIIEE